MQEKREKGKFKSCRPDFYHATAIQGPFESPVDCGSAFARSLLGQRVLPEHSESHREAVGGVLPALAVRRTKDSNFLVDVRRYGPTLAARLELIATNCIR